MSKHTDDIATDPYYRRQGKDLVDLLHDRGFLAEDVSRECMNWLEGYIAFVIGTACESSVRANNLIKKIRTLDARGSK